MLAREGRPVKNVAAGCGEEAQGTGSGFTILMVVTRSRKRMDCSLTVMSSTTVRLVISSVRAVVLERRSVSSARSLSASLFFSIALMLELSCAICPSSCRRSALSFSRSSRVSRSLPRASHAARSCATTAASARGSAR